jgi:hypothetical protein
MWLVVVAVGKKEKNVDDLMVIMDGRNEPVVVLDIEDRHRLSAGNFDLVCGRQNLAQLDKGFKSAAADKLFPMIQGWSGRGMKSGIFAQAFDGDDTHWESGLNVA